MNKLLALTLLASCASSTEPAVESSSPAAAVAPPRAEGAAEAAGGKGTAEAVGTPGGEGSAQAAGAVGGERPAVAVAPTGGKPSPSNTGSAVPSSSEQQARRAGLLGNDTLTQGGDFASLTGTGPSGAPAGKGSTHHGSGVPTLRIGRPTVTGKLDQAILDRYLKRNFSRLQYCYEKELLGVPTLAGTVTATFTIAGTGAVSSSTASGVHENVAACVATAIQEIAFPRPSDRRDVQVVYPITYAPGS